MKVFFLIIGLMVGGIGVASTQAHEMAEMEAIFLRANASEMSSALALAGASAGVLNSEELAKALTALKQAGVTIFGHPRTITTNGERCLVQVGREFRYPCEYPENAKSPGKEIPTSYQTRPLGLSIEFTPQIDSQRNRIRFRVEPRVTKFLGFVDYADSSQKNGLREGGVWRPIFSSFEVAADLDLASGQTALLGGKAEEAFSDAGKTGESVHSPDGRFIYIFVTARILKDR